MNVYHDDNYEHVQPFDEVVSAQPWQFATPSYNLPKASASTPIATFVGFQNHPPNTNINLVPTNLEMERLHLLSIDWSSFITLTKDRPINQFLYHI